jgi:hypothetical protein
MAIRFTRGNSDFGRITDPTNLTAATIAAGDKVSLADTAEDGVPIGVEISPIYLYTAQSKMPRDSGVTQVSFNATPTIMNTDLQNLAFALGEDSAYSAGPPITFNFRKDTLGEAAIAWYSEGKAGTGLLRRIFAPLSRLTGLGNLQQAKSAWMAINPTYTVLDPGTDPSGAPIHPLQIADLAA